MSNFKSKDRSISRNVSVLSVPFTHLIITNGFVLLPILGHFKETNCRHKQKTNKANKEENDSKVFGTSIHVGNHFLKRFQCNAGIPLLIDCSSNTLVP